MNTAPHTNSALTHRSSGLISALLVLLAFALGFAEFVLIGITEDVAQGLGVQLTLVGDVVGYYALACAVATPVVALATARLPRFRVMLVLLAIFNAGNVITMFATTFPVFVFSRVLPAITSGTLLALSLTLAADVVPKNRIEKVVGLILAGFSLSSVIGVPIGTMLSSAFGWHAAYALVLGLGLVVSAALLPTLLQPSSSDTGATATLRAQLRILTDGRILTNIAMILAGAASTYVFYTYISPIMTDVMELNTAEVSAVLLLFGAACVGSNMLSGWVAARFGLRALPITFVAHALLLALLAITTPLGVIGVPNMLLVGVLMYVMNSTVQMLFQNVARSDYPAALTFSASLHPMSFNAGIAIGSFIGGIVVNTGGLLATGPVGAMLAATAGVLAVVLLRLFDTSKNRRTSLSQEF